MPSKEYLEMLKKEEGDPLQPIESTPKEKAKDFWFYHRAIFLAVGIAVAFIAFFVYEMVTKVDPDVEIAIITAHQYVPNETLEALQQDFTAFANDYNEDGHVSVSINLYNPATGEDAEAADPNMQMATVTKMMADMSSMTSIIFLTDNFDDTQALYELFSVKDDVSTIADTAQEAGPLLSETAMKPLITEFSEPAALEMYEYFHENLIITTRIMLVENFSDAEQKNYNNSMDVYNSIVNE